MVCKANSVVFMTNTVASRANIVIFRVKKSCILGKYSDILGPQKGHLWAIQWYGTLGQIRYNANTV